MMEKCTPNLMYFAFKIGKLNFLPYFALWYTFTLLKLNYKQTGHFYFLILSLFRIEPLYGSLRFEFILSKLTSNFH